MSQAQSAPTRHDIEVALIQKCWTDPEFRKKVVADPKGMLEEHTGQKLPADVKIYIHEEDARSLHFTIPTPPADVAELSEEDLERVAGGTDIIIATAAFGLFGTAIMSAAGVTALNKGNLGW